MNSEEERFIGRERAEEIDRLQAENERLKGIVAVYDGIAADSQGVIGYHLNGDVANWSEFDHLFEPKRDEYHDGHNVHTYSNGLTWCHSCSQEVVPEKSDG